MTAVETTRVHPEVLADGVIAYVGEQGMPNAVTVEGADGVVVIDSLFTPRHARMMMDALRAETEKPILALINTHFHGDHTLGNREIPTDRIIAHSSVRDRLRTGGAAYLELLLGVRPDLAPEIGELDFVLPTEFVDSALDLDLGGTTVRVRSVGRPAHTDGDLTVTVVEPDILVASDLLFNGILPVARDADLVGWAAALRDLRRSFTGTVVVPGHGAVGGPELFDEQLTVLNNIVECVAAVRAEGGTPEAARDRALRVVGPLRHAEERIDAYVAWLWPRQVASLW